MVPLISILIPIYKVKETFLRRCIESAINQSFEDIEIILVDDGSPDNCGKICDAYAAQDKRIKVIHKLNDGLSAARNTAFDAASGKYISFLDGDDYLEPIACERAYNVACEQNVQMVFWNSYRDYSKKKVPVSLMGDKQLQFDKSGCEELQVRVLDFNSGISTVWAKLINREFLINHNIRHIDALQQGAEGFVFNIQLFEYLESACYLPDFLLHYTYNENSISHSFDEKNFYKIVDCFEYVNKFIQTSKNKNKLQSKLYNRLLYVVITTGVTGVFNPGNKKSYADKVQEYKKFLNEPLIKEALKKGDRHEMSLMRRILLWFIRYHIFIFFPFIGLIRKIQLKVGLKSH